MLIASHRTCFSDLNRLSQYIHNCSPLPPNGDPYLSFVVTLRHRLYTQLSPSHPRQKASVGVRLVRPTPTYVGPRRGGEARPPEAQIVPESARSVRRRLRGVQLGHPSAATRGGQVRHWCQVAAVSVEAAVAIYSARYRRHWGAELALQGARLRFSRAYLAFQASSCQAGMLTFGTSSIGFDPADSAQYAAEAATILGGPPRGQDRY